MPLDPDWATPPTLTAVTPQVPGDHATGAEGEVCIFTGLETEKYSVLPDLLNIAPMLLYVAPPLGLEMDAVNALTAEVAGSEVIGFEFASTIDNEEVKGTAVGFWLLFV